MKKFLFLFTLLLAVLVPATSHAATNFLVRVSNTSGISLRHASAASSLPSLGNEISLNTGMTSASASNSNVGFNSNSTNNITAIRINGNSISKTSIRVLISNYSIWQLNNQSGWGNGCLVEVYRSGDPDRFEYPINTNINVVGANILSAQRSNFGSSTMSAAATSGQQMFHYGEYYEFTTDAQATEKSISAGSVTETDNGNGTWTYRFTPEINAQSLTNPPTMNLTVSNTVNVTTTVDAPDHIIGFLINGSDDGISKPGAGLTTYNNIPKGADVKVYVDQEAYECTYGEGLDCPFTPISDIDGCAGYYQFTANSNTSFNIKFNAPVEGVTYFNVYINLDKNNTAYAVDNHGTTTYLNLGTNTVQIPDEESGYIEVFPVDGYAFTSFVDADEGNFDFMSFDNIQTKQVKITKTVVKEFSTTGSDTYDTPNHHFNVTTVNMSTIPSYPFTINVVDDPSNVFVAVGNGETINAENNRELTLTQGINNLSYNQYDTWLIIGSRDFNSLYEVTDNGTVLVSDARPKVFKIALDKESTQNKVVTITANAPFVGDHHFGIILNGLEGLDRISYGNGESDRSDLNLTGLHDGVYNDIQFNVGDSFRVWIKKTHDVIEFSQNEVAIEPSAWGYYEFTPDDNDDIIITLGEKVDDRPTFTFYTDTPGSVTYIQDWVNDEVTPISQTVTEVHFNPDHEYRIQLGDEPNEAYYIRNGVTTNLDISYSISYTPQAGDRVKVFFADGLLPTFTLSIDDASKVESFKMIGTDNNDDPVTETIVLHNGDNTIEISPFAESYRLTPVSGAVALNATLDGDAQKVVYNSSRGWYTINVGGVGIQEDSKVVFTFKADPVITVSFVNEGTEGFLKFHEVNGADVPMSELLVGKTVASGSEIWFSYDKNNYIINSIVVNGEALTSYSGVIYYENLYDDLSIVFDVTPVSYIPFTINVDTPSNIVLTNGNNTIDLEVHDENDQIIEGITSFTFTNMVTTLNPVIDIAAIQNIVITSVSDGTNQYTPGEDRAYHIELTPNMVINVTTQTVSFDEQFVVVFHGPKATPSMSSSSKRNYTFENHDAEAQYQHFAVNFNSAYDGYFMLNNGAIYKNEYVYLNDQLIESEMELYIFTPSHGDILRIYNGIIDEDDAVEIAEPDKHDVEFMVSMDLIDKVKVSREGIQDLDNITTATFSELDGTHLRITTTDNSQFKVLVTPLQQRDNAPKHAPKLTSDVQGEFTSSYELAVTQPSKVAIYFDDTTSGITDIDAVQDSLKANLYNLQGILIKADATSADLKNLPAGLYIYGNQKVAVK